MKEHSVRPRKSANRLDFIRRANRSELRRLCDADGVHHVPVQLHLLREKFFCLAQVDLSVIGFRQKQLGSPSVKLRGASFVRLDVGTLVTDHAVKRLAKLGETKRVAAVPVNTKKTSQSISKICRMRSHTSAVHSSSP